MSAEKSEKRFALQVEAAELQWPPDVPVRRLPKTFPRVEGFDLNTKPEGLDNPELIRRSRRVGYFRQKESEDSLPEILKSETVDRETRRLLYRTIGTRALSGEELPASLAGEVELVRITLNHTVHCESSSLRGRLTGERIRYRYFSECDLDGCAAKRLAFKSSAEWPTLGQLIYILDNSSIGDCHNLVLGWPEDQIVYGMSKEDDRETLSGCVSASSLFYPDLERWYDTALQRFLEQREPETSQLLLDTISLMAGV